MRVSRRVLIVEDDFITSKGLEALLEELGYTPIKTVSNGAAAIEAVKALSPDIILMDMFIKGDMNGLETALNINMNYATPIVFTTAYKKSEFFKKIEETGLFDFVSKPYTDGEEIRRAIESRFIDPRKVSKTQFIESMRHNS